MKLAEALQERADLNIRIAQLRSRLLNNAVVQENEEPAEDPSELQEELEECYRRLKELITRINLTNAQVTLNGRTLTECIAERDVLTSRISANRELISEASNLGRRATRTEIVIKSAVNVRDLQKQTDHLSAQLRELDNRIQETNWKEELK